MAQIARLVSLIFKFLSANYGNTWAKGLECSAEEDRFSVWSQAVSGLTRWQLAYGKKKILNGECYLEFPPTAAQFRVLCKGMPDSFNTLTNPPKAEITRFDQKYDINWFMSLSGAHKEKVYEGSIMAYPALRYFLETSKESFLDEIFQKSVWIKPMIQAFRSCYQIDSLVGFKIEDLGTKG